MKGLVSLLGAGPGDEELVTVKGARRLKEADVLVYDRLVNQELFRYIKPGCEMIDVGKQPGMPCIRQEDIETILIEQASQGKHVVRLKSGDPYIFGRGGEEGQGLVKAGIPFEVIPGVSSALAGPTYAGIPVTYRDVATSFHVFTGHLKDETESLNWEAISQLKGTLIFLMGMKNLSTIVGQLMERGFAKETPVAIIEWATHPQQRSIDGQLDTIESLVEEHQFKAPSIIVVGDVVAFRQELNFHEQLPLTGKRIFLQQSDTGRLPRLLKDHGATLLQFPARTRVEAVELKLPDFKTIDGLVIADGSSWTLFLKALRARGVDLRSLQGIKFAAIGHHTCQLLEQSGLILDYKGLSISDSKLKDNLDAESQNWYILAPKHKKEELQKVYAYPILETHDVDFDSELKPQEWTNLDMVCLPNSVAATNFVAVSQSLNEEFDQIPIIVMGASTREVLEKAGFTNIVETDEATIVSIVEKSIQLSR